MRSTTVISQIMTLGAVCLLACVSETIAASRAITLEEAEFGTPDAACASSPKMPLFNRAGVSGTTSAFVQTPFACGEGTLGSASFGNDTVLTALYSASPSNSAEIRFSWADPANDGSWIRLTTSGAGVYPNPGVYLGVGGKISMKVAVFGQDAAGAESPAGGLEFCLLFRESGAIVPLGSDTGASSAAIEFAGIDGKTGSAPNGGAKLTHSATRQFHALEWLIISDTEIQLTVDGNAATKKVVSFNLGNGKLDAANSRGTLESLGIRKPADDDTTKKWFVNIDDVKIEAPGVTDPIAIRTPVLWTDTAVTVLNVNPATTEVRLYKNAAVANTGNPAGANQFTFTGVSLAIGDVLTATQVVDGVESIPSVPVTVLPPGLRVAMAVREIASVTNPQVGGNGGATGNIEWVGENLATSGAPGGQLVRMSPCWQTVTIDPAATTTKVRAFAGTAPNGKLDGAVAPWYVLEHLALSIDSANPFPGPFTLYVDSVESGGVVFGNFDSITAPGANGATLFRQPSFSGSTDKFLNGFGSTITPNISQVVNERADSGANSIKIQFQFNSTSVGNWLRLTTSGTTNLPNPLIRLDQPFTLRILFVPSTGLGTGPTINVQPEAATALIGDAATFHVVATGTGTLHYQWLRDGKPIGTDADTLTITSAQASDAGLISVSICDETGPAHSAAVQLQVLPCPVPFADVDRDGDVDQADFGVFQRCFTGPGEGFGDRTLLPGCKCLALGADPIDVDENDQAAFLKCITGPTIPWSQALTPDCVP